VVIRVTLTMIGKAAITYSYALIYLYTPEIYPTVVRGAGLGVASMMSRIGGVVAPLIADLVSRSLFSTHDTTLSCFVHGAGLDKNRNIADHSKTNI